MIYVSIAGKNQTETQAIFFFCWQFFYRYRKKRSKGFIKIDARIIYQASKLREQSALLYSVFFCPTILYIVSVIGLDFRNDFQHTSPTHMNGSYIITKAIQCV
jgi:hypothetical protein